MKFPPYTIGDRKFILDHLGSFSMEVLPDKEGAKSIKILVNFHCHCFTEAYDGIDAHAYHHQGEIRSFSEERHALSHELPNFIRGIAERKVMFTRETNYLIVEVVDQDGVKVRYSIFFDLKRARDDHHDLVLTVESAYVKESLPKHLDKIRFRILAAKVAQGQKVRSPNLHQK